MTNKKSKGSILCVDDNVDFCKLLVDFFGQKGYTVFSAFDARDGYNIIKSEKIDLLLLDIRMEEIDGVGLMKKLRAENIVIPTIVITAYSNAKDLIEAENFKLYGYFEKPVPLNQVNETVEKCFKEAKL